MADAGDIYIELELNQQTSTATGASVGNIGGDVLKNGLGTIADIVGPAAVRDRDTSLTLDTDNVCLFVDRLYYSDDRMTEEAERLNSSKGRSLAYVDVINTTAAVGKANPGPAAGTINEITFTNQIAVSGMKLQNIKGCYTVTDYTTQQAAGPVSLTPRFSRDYTGRYKMLATPKADGYNVRINDMLYYNKEVTNVAYKVSELESIYASPVALNTALYSVDAITAKVGAFNPKTNLFPAAASYQLNDLVLRDLEGSHHFFGTNVSVAYGAELDDFVLISEKPVEFLHTFPRNESTNFDYQVRYFAEIVRSLAMKDGRVEVFT